MKKSNYTHFHKDVKQYGIDYAIQHTLNAGFEAVEVFDNPGFSRWLSDNESFLHLQEKLISSKLDVSCFSALTNLLADNVGEIMENLHGLIELAAKLGSPYFHHTLVPELKFFDDEPTFESVFERVADNAEKIALWCNQNNLVCLYEPQGKYFNGINNLKFLIDEMRKRGRIVGVCGDTGNSMFVDCAPDKLFEFFKDDVKHIHLKDYKIVDTPQGKFYKIINGKYLIPAPVGLGNANVKACLQCLGDYSGYFSIESEETDEEIRKLEDIIGI